MNWANEFIGLTFKDRGRGSSGVDCYGLIILVFENVKRLILRDYDYESCKDSLSISQLLSNDTDWPFLEVVRAGNANFEGMLCKLKEFDVIVFKRAGLEQHLGIVVNKTHMLHISEGCNSRLENYRCGYWKPKIVAVYRHRELLQNV